MLIETRKQWGALASRGSTYLLSTRGVKAHYTGGPVSRATLADHDLCREAIRGYQLGHMVGNGWNDFGYTLWVCNHTVGMGRGPHVLPAANGPGLNSGHYAVLFLVGTSGVTEPTDNMKRLFLDARRWLMQNGNAGTEISYHRRGYATTCPGNPIAAWIDRGAGLPVVAVPVPIPGPGEDMRYSAFGLDEKDQTLIPPNQWVNIPFREEYADPDGDHTPGLNPTILLGDPAVYTLEFGATLSGAMGAVVEVRTCEYIYRSDVKPSPIDEIIEVGDPSTCILTQEERVHHTAVGSVQEGRKLRIQVRHTVPATTPVHVTRARARLLFME